MDETTNPKTETETNPGQQPGPKTLGTERVLYVVLAVLALVGFVVASPWSNATDGNLTVAAARIGMLGTGVALVCFAAQMVLNIWFPEARSRRAAVAGFECAGLLLAAISLALTF